MNVPCQVTRLTAGQIRLHIPSLTTQPEIIQPLLQFVMKLPGVTSIAIEPAGADLVIQHETTPGADDLILLALAGQPTAPVARMSPTPTTLDRSTASPFADCTLIHATRGRARLQFPHLSNQDDLGGVLGHYLTQQPGVSHVRLSPLTQSVIVHYDPALADVESLVRLASEYHPAPQEIEEWRAARNAKAQQDVLSPQRRKVDLCLAAIALALSFFGGWLAHLIVIALLIASSWWVFRRAAWAIQQRQFVTFESTAAGVLIILCLAGMLWQAALLVMLLLVIALLHGRSASTAAGPPVTVVTPPAPVSQQGEIGNEYVSIAGAS